MPAGLVAIVGATGTGKSELGLDLSETLLAQGVVAEIVNTDAMQQYRGMDIGTAKLPEHARRGIPHHLIDTLEVTAESTVAGYQASALNRIGEISSRGAVPILVGGSGLYVSSLLYDFRFPGTDPVIRARFEAELDHDGPAVLHQRLVAVDPGAAASIGPRNGRRIVRALEVIELTGRLFGNGLPDEREFRAPTTIVALEAERADLVRTLDARVESMWRAGLVDEVDGLISAGIERGTTASRAIGYAQAIDQLHGRRSQAEAIAETQALTRRYARRQVGWFRRYPSAVRLERGDPAGPATAARAVIEGMRRSAG